MPSSAENVKIFAADPTGSKRSQLAAMMRNLPAQANQIAAWRSQCVRALESGISRDRVLPIWNRLDSAAAKIAELSAFLGRAWNVARDRGELAGNAPTISVVFPDRPAGLAGYQEVVAIAAAGAVALAGVAALLVLAINAAPIALAIGATAAGLLAIGASLTALMGTIATAIAVLNSGGSGTIGVVGGSVAVIGLALALLLLGRKGKS